MDFWRDPTSQTLLHLKSLVETLGRLVICSATVWGSHFVPLPVSNLPLPLVSLQLALPAVVSSLE